MTAQSQWSTIAARILYEAYPDCDLLPIEPPHPGEPIGAFARRAEQAGDTLFLFLCREANDDIDADEYRQRLDGALRDIEQVHHAFGSPRLTACPVRPSLPILPQPPLDTKPM